MTDCSLFVITSGYIYILDSHTMSKKRPHISAFVQYEIDYGVGCMIQLFMYQLRSVKTLLYIDCEPPLIYGAGEVINTATRAANLHFHFY